MIKNIAKGLKIKRVESFKKQDLIYKILDTQAIVVSESKASKKEAPEKMPLKVTEIQPVRERLRPRQKENSVERNFA